MENQIDSFDKEIGKPFSYNGRMVVAIQDNIFPPNHGCNVCVFYTDRCAAMELFCTARSRKDKTGVHFEFCKEDCAKQDVVAGWKKVNIEFACKGTLFVKTDKDEDAIAAAKEHFGARLELSSTVPFVHDFSFNIIPEKKIVSVVDVEGPNIFEL